MHRCGPCKRIAPQFETFPEKYPEVIFLKIDVDKCVETAESQGITAMPTFLFYKNNDLEFRLQGADLAHLERKIKSILADE